MIQVERGATRIVFVFKRFVIKIPTFKQFSLFLNGMLANLQEKQWSGHHPDLARVIYCGRLGFLLVMEKAEVLNNDAGWLQKKLQNKYRDDDLKDFLLSDCKNSNWGYINGQLKKIDYGN